MKINWSICVPRRLSHLWTMTMDRTNVRFHRLGMTLILIMICLTVFTWVVEKIHISFEVVAKGPAQPVPCKSVYHQPSGNGQVEAHGRTLMTHLIGGLGNQLWIYSALYGLAKKTGRKAIACVGYDMRDLLPNLSIPLYTYEQCTKFREKHKNESITVGQRGSHFYYDVEMIDTLRVSKKQYAFVCCYFQNLGFYVEYFDDLRAQFTIKEKYKSKAQESLRDLLKQNRNGTKYSTENGLSLINDKKPVFITIHIRRGNMLAEKTVRQPSISYYKKSMDYFRKKHGKSVAFIVATEDLKWAKANITGNDVYYTGDTGPKSREDEFAIALACNHTIMSVGTFGWWMGFLTGGEVVYYKDWVKGSWTQWYRPGHFYPHWWKPM